MNSAVRSLVVASQHAGNVMERMTAVTRQMNPKKSVVREGQREKNPEEKKPSRDIIVTLDYKIKQNF